MTMYKNDIWDKYSGLYNSVEYSIRYLEGSGDEGMTDFGNDELVSNIKINLNQLRIYLEEIFIISENPDEAIHIPPLILKINNLLESDNTRFAGGSKNSPLSIDAGSLVMNAENILNEILVENGYPYEHPNYSLSGVNLSKIAINRTMGIPLLIIFLILTIRVFTEESELGIDKLIKMNPKGRFVPYLAKVFALTFTLAVFIITLLISSLLLGTVFGTGLGHLDYPEVLINFKLWARPENLRMLDSSYLGITTTMNLIARWIYLFIIFSFLYFSMVALLNTFFKRKQLVVLSSIILLVLISFINNKTILLSNYGTYIPSPLLGEKYSELADDVDTKWYFFYLIPIVFGLINLYICTKLEKHRVIQALFRSGKIKDIEITLNNLKNSKPNKFPIIGFEALKIFRQQEVFMILILLACIFTLYGVNMQLEYKKLVQTKLNYAMVDLSNPNLDPISINQSAEFIEAINSQDSKRISAYNKNKIQYFASSSHGFRGYGSDQFPIETLMLNISQEDAAIEGNNKPEILGFFPIKSSPYDEFKDLNAMRSYLSYSKRAHPSIHMIGNYFYGGVWGVGMLVLVAFFFTQGFSDEQEKKSLPILLLTPFKKHKIFSSKQLISGFFLFSLMMSWAIWMIYGASIGQLSDIDYPIQTYSYESNQTGGYQRFLNRGLTDEFGKLIETKTDATLKPIGVNYVPVWKQNIKLVLLIAASGLFLINIGIVLSIFITNRWFTAGLISLICLLGYFVTFRIYSIFTAILPFQHLYPYSVAWGRLSLRYGMGFLNTGFSIIVLAVWTAIIYIIGKYGFKKMVRG